MIPSLPTLDILPVESLILHEEHDAQRSLPLVEKLRAAGILRNPPIVMPLMDGTKRYMVLDGANRVTSLQGLEFPHVVAQVVKADDPNVSLHTWNHVIWGIPPKELVSELKKLTGLQLVKVDPHNSLDAPPYVPMNLRLPDGKLYVLAEEPSDLTSHIRMLHAVVNTYKSRGSLDRTSQTLIDTFRDVHRDLTGLIIFPRFKVKTVLKLAGRKTVLPTGITRFTVSPRALHLNYPLHELSSGKPVEYKREYLKQWVDERVKKKGVRMYTEATFLYDE